MSSNLKMNDYQVIIKNTSRSNRNTNNANATGSSVTNTNAATKQDINNITKQLHELQNENEQLKGQINTIETTATTVEDSTSLFSSTETIEYISLAAIGLAAIMFIIAIVQRSRLKKMRKSYDTFMSGNDGKNLEEAILQYFKQIDTIKEKQQDQDTKLNKVSNTLQNELQHLKSTLDGQIKDLQENLLVVYQKSAIIKYDAFKEMGGKLSFAIALLDKKNNGFVLNSMHNREGCYTYIKEIINGESYVLMCDEEKEVVSKAMQSDKLIEDSDITFR